MEEDREDFTLGKEFSFAGELDSDGEMELDTSGCVANDRLYNYTYHFMTKDEAVDLIEHLTVVFDIQSEEQDL